MFLQVYRDKTSFCCWLFALFVKIATCSVNQAVLELRSLCLYLLVLGLKEHTATAQQK